MKIFKRTMAVILSAAMVFGLTACGGKKTDSAAGTDKAAVDSAGSGSAKEVLTVVTDGDVGNMGPFGSGNSFAYLQDQVYQSLFAYGYDMEITPVLAESWDMEDETHYVFHLRDGLHDSENNPITAEDVLFSMNLYTSDATYSQYVQHIDFDKTKVVDDSTLDLFFADTNAFAFSQLAGVRVVTKAAWEASEDEMVTDPVGSGPYKLKEYVSGSYFTLDINENYWGEKPEIKEIRFNVVSEPSQRTTQLETGAADLVMNLQSSDVEYIKNKEGYEVDCHICTQSMTMFFNMTENSVMSSKELRQAVCYAIDNNAMNVAAYGGYCAPAKAFFSTAMMDYTDDMEKDIYTSCNKEKSAEMIEASGKKGSSIHIATDGSPQETTIAEMIQSILIEQGFEVIIDSYDGATIWSVASDPTQWDLLLMIASAPSGSGLDEMTAFLAGLNFSQWNGAEYDKAVSLMTEASNTVDVEKRLDLTRQALEIVEEEVPAYAIVQIAQNYAYDTALNFRVWNQASMYAADLKMN